MSEKLKGNGQDYLPPDLPEVIYAAFQEYRKNDWNWMQEKLFDKSHPPDERFNKVKP